MTRVIWRMLIIGALVLLGVVPTGENQVTAGGSWSAWLYRQDTGMLVHVFPDGAPSTSMPFPLPPGYTEYPYDVAISLSGARLAACLNDPSGTSSVHVYDIYMGLWTAAYVAPGPIVACHVGNYSFSEDESLLAFGILNHWPGTPDTRPDWEVIVMDTATSIVHYRLDATSPAVAALGVDMGGSRPTITAFSPGVLAFAPIRWGTEGAQEYPSVVWQLESGFVSVVGPYGKSSLDFHLPNSEAIWIDERDDFSKGTLEGMGYLYNVVMYSNKAGALYPIYHRDNAIVERAVFINDGQEIAVRTYVAPGPAVWSYLGRGGTSGPLSVPNNVYDVWGVMDGLVYLSPTGAPGGGPVFAHHRMSGAAPGTYNLWTGDPSGYWRIIWVTPLTGGAGLPAFPQVLPSLPGIVITLPPLLQVTPLLINPPQLFTLQPPAMTLAPISPPLVVTLAPLSPQLQVTLAPISPGISVVPGAPQLVTLAPVVTPGVPVGQPPTLGLRIGGIARINTTEGDQLRMRSGPGTEFNVLFSLDNGTSVSILDGPNVSGNLTWWYVRTTDGRTGWVVEGVPEGNGWLETLIPTG